MKAVVLAGGKGTRLRPYTVAFPKPLAPVGDMPVLEIVLRQLARAGFESVTLSVGHLASMIEAFAGDGSQWGLAIDYLREEAPLGTAGALAMLRTDATEFLVMNGDVLTTIDYAGLVQAHRESGAMATAVTTHREFPVEFGVVHTDERGDLVRWEEKPVHAHDISIGIYVLSAGAVSLIKAGESLGMPDLLARIMAGGGRVRCETTSAYWLDIGRIGDYEQAQTDFEQMRGRFLGE